ncbi:MAG: DNA cytosine methyltransferase [Flavobacteriales bacterium]|nr:DNA cytosine methyltransferase [Flavobacteriales bacterium]
MPKAISLFAGAGGCSLGFKQANYDIVFATDFDKAAMQTYALNLSGASIACKDICEIDFQELMVALKLKAGELDVLIGGPPCQGFSTAGPRFWDDPRNHLLKQYVRAIEVVKPKWLMMENVEGLLTTKGGEYVAEVVKAFVRLGYRVRIEKVYAHEYGVPQRRKRVIILGNRLGKDFTFPTATVPSHGRIFRRGGITLEQAFHGLPHPGHVNQPVPYDADMEGEWAAFLASDSGLVTDHFTPEVEPLQEQRIAALGPGQTMKDLPEQLQHPSFQKRANRRVMDGTPSEKRGGSPSGLKRLHYDEPSLTITGAATREFIHPIENRTLTIREAARAQTFPDHFTFIGSRSDRIQQIGNAIPPLLARVFAEHIAEQGFQRTSHEGEGRFLGFKLTKSQGLSPALERTSGLLRSLLTTSHQEQLYFEDAG